MSFQPDTTIEIDKTSHDYGAVQKDSLNSADFMITNTGSQPLIISRISASCGCTHVAWDKQPIAPGNTTSIRIDMTLSETGNFNKTVVIYCNTNESPVRLTVTGLTID